MKTWITNKNVYATASLLWLLCGYGRLAAQTDITENGGVLFAELQNSNDRESYNKLIDNYPLSKYLVQWTPGHGIYYASAYPSVVDGYALYSADDAPGRDLKSWQLEGSNDGNTWLLIDARRNEYFEARLQRKAYACQQSTAAYKHFRLVMLENNGDPLLQLGELELFSRRAPQRPTGLAASALPRQGVQLRWDTPVADSVVVEKSADGKQYHRIATVPADENGFADMLPACDKQYAYRLRAMNGAGVSNVSAYAVVRTVPAPGLRDMTRYADGVVSARLRNDGDEGIDKLTDNNPYSKYFVRSTAAWVQYQFRRAGTVTHYALTSANDDPTRDPSAWCLSGSNDGNTWQVLDQRRGEHFSQRHEARTYRVNPPGKYTYYRLEITANNGATSMQLGEWQLFGEGSGTIQKKVAPPQDLTAAAVSGFQVNLVWKDLAINETGYRLERSTDNRHWIMAGMLPANDNFFFCRYLRPLTRYYFRLRAEGGKSSSVYQYTTAITPSGEPPRTWQEHWFGHEENLSRRYHDDSLAIYCDAKVDTAIQWVTRDFRKVWRYTQKHYGSFGAPHLFLVMHSVDKPELTGGHPAATFNEHHDWRNTIDLANRDWQIRSDWNLGATTHEIAHIVEGASKDVDHSPSFAIWGDSKWAEIFGYDVYKGLGWEREAAQLYEDMMQKQDNFPRPGTFWFKNWFYPIYSSSGGTETLNRYFELLAKYFPQHNSAYVRDLNMGEFIHFWSAAAGYDLRQQAEVAFGWNETYEMQLAQAKLDYAIQYKER